MLLYAEQHTDLNSCAQAFNTKGGLQIPFPEALPINFDTLNRFCADFVSGKLRSKAEAKAFAAKALQSDFSTRNQAKREPRKKAPPVERGVSEAFDAAYDLTGLVVVATPKNFNDVVLEDGVDVLLLLHARACEPCAHFAVYFKRVAERFHDLSIPSLRMARMDVTHATPPPRMNLLGHGNLPLLVMLPAFNKQEPWIFFSGVGKPQEIMKWVQKHAYIPFELPNLPHLTEEQRVLYKEQIREREEHLDSKAAEDAEAQRLEEEAQALFLSRRQSKNMVEEAGNDEF
jgi:hypothetical protein